MRRIVYVTAALILLALSNPAEAGPLRGRVRAQPAASSCQSGSCSVSSSHTSTGTSSWVCGPDGCRIVRTATEESARSVTVTATSSATALDEVNARRAARGLRPFIHDPLLSAAAERCAAFRAERRLFGHTDNDFRFLGGARASAAGCAAYPASYGFLACCVYDNYTYAGAASVTGPDGRVYHHLFVR